MLKAYINQRGLKNRQKPFTAPDEQLNYNGLIIDVGDYARHTITLCVQKPPCIGMFGVKPGAAQFYCPNDSLSPVVVLKWSICLGLEIEYAAAYLAGGTIKSVCQPLHFVVSNGNDVAI